MNNASAEFFQIVLARTVEDFRVAADCRARVDLGERRKLEAFDRPESLMWIRSGSAGDLAKAGEFAAREGYSVFTYPPTENDPLGRARREVLASLPAPRPLWRR